MANDPVAAVEDLVRGIDAETIGPIGLGQVNGRYFCFHAGIGFDAKVVQAVERHASLKRWLGHPLFISAGLSTWMRGYDRKHPHFRLDAGRHGVIEDGFFSIVLNTNPYTYLGNRPLDLSPHAGLDKGLVAITFTTMKARAILTSLAGALRGGGVKPAKHLDIRTSVEQLRIEHERPFPYQLDGDALGETSRLDITHVPEAVKLVFPISG
jgi:diacylglycerol kinase family enzyme